MPTIDESIPDALRDAIGQVISEQRRQWRRERELIEAQAQVILADLRASVVTLQATVERQLHDALMRFESQIMDRLGALRDGEKGDPGAAGERGPEGPRGPDGVAGPAGEPGAAGAKGEAGTDGQQGAAGASGARGEKGETGERGAAGEPGKAGEQGPTGSKGEPGAAGERGPAGADGGPGPEGKIGPQGLKGEPGAIGERGERGEKGERGADGTMPIARTWKAGVFAAGAVVTHKGATWQAIRETDDEPPTSDWIELVPAGADGRSPQVRGLWQADDKYEALDIVARDGGSYIARKADPGPCPGDGWQSLVKPGKTGKDGSSGPAGERGPAGPAGEPGRTVKLVGWRIDRANYCAIAKMSDATEVSLSLRELFEQFNAETR